MKFLHEPVGTRNSYDIGCIVHSGCNVVGNYCAGPCGDENPWNHIL